jgi:hypothetical protein
MIKQQQDEGEKKKMMSVKSLSGSQALDIGWLW